MFSCSGSGFSFICIGREQLLVFSLFVAIGAIFLCFYRSYFDLPNFYEIS